MGLDAYCPSRSASEHRWTNGGLMKNVSAFNALKSLHTGEVVGSIPTAPPAKAQ
jgi:hypothetical protein